MASVTIKNSSNVTFTFQDSDCSDVDDDTQCNLNVQPTPVSDSDQTFVFDTDGVTRRVTISGKLTVATSTRTDSGTTLTIEDQKAFLRAIVNGNQQGVTFNSTYCTNLKLFVQRVKFKEESGNPNMLDYILEMNEGE